MIKKNTFALTVHEMCGDDKNVTFFCLIFPGTGFDDAHTQRERQRQDTVT